MLKVSYWFNDDRREGYFFGDYDEFDFKQFVKDNLKEDFMDTEKYSVYEDDYEICVNDGEKVVAKYLFGMAEQYDLYSVVAIIGGEDYIREDCKWESWLIHGTHEDFREVAEAAHDWAVGVWLWEEDRDDEEVCLSLREHTIECDELGEIVGDEVYECESDLWYTREELLKVANGTGEPLRRQLMG